MLRLPRPAFASRRVGALSISGRAGSSDEVVFSVVEGRGLLSGLEVKCFMGFVCFLVIDAGLNVEMFGLKVVGLAFTEVLK